MGQSRFGTMSLSALVDQKSTLRARRLVIGELIHVQAVDCLEGWGHNKEATSQAAAGATRECGQETGMGAVPTLLILSLAKPTLALLAAI